MLHELPLSHVMSHCLRVINNCGRNKKRNAPLFSLHFESWRDCRAPPLPLRFVAAARLYCDVAVSAAEL